MVVPQSGMIAVLGSFPWRRVVGVHSIGFLPGERFNRIRSILPRGSVFALRQAAHVSLAVYDLKRSSRV